jgi:hypothetical protein
MANLFFIAERCPLSLSLAGFCLNQGERCVEIVDSTTWVITVKDNSTLCHAAANILDIIDNHRSQRIFVQGTSKNIDAVILASALSGLPVFLVDAADNSLSINSSISNGVTKIYSTDLTKLNFSQSMIELNEEEDPMDDNVVLVSPRYPPKPDWFHNYTFFTIVPEQQYSHDNYSLPNYVVEGSEVDNQQRVQAIKIQKFYVRESQSSWKSFKQQLHGPNVAI